MGLRRTRLTIRGFKSIRELDIGLGPLTVLIGANGAGKSNFIEFFRMLKWMMEGGGQFQIYAAKHGPASRLLFDGPKSTEKIAGDVVFLFDAFIGRSFAFELVHGSGDRFFFQNERFGASERESPLADFREIGEFGYPESRVRELAEMGDPPAGKVRELIRQCMFFHLRDTSDQARIRQKQNVDDGWRLWEDAGNLAPFLYRLQQAPLKGSVDLPEFKAHMLTKLVMPFFAEYQFTPENGNVLLGWREVGSDVVFHAGQAADGMLRAMALIALLAQPEESLPSMILLDEPELGLHPYALEIVAELIKGASQHTQVVVATQSATLLDAFEPEDVVVVTREGRESKFERKNADELRDWLEDYTLGELWRKNVLGGGPLA